MWSILALAIVSPHTALVPRRAALHRAASAEAREAVRWATSAPPPRRRAAARATVALLDGDIDRVDGPQTPYVSPRGAAVALMLLFWTWPWALTFGLSKLLPILAPRSGVAGLVFTALSYIARQLDVLEVVAARLLVAAACGACIGLERKDADKPTGLRSMTLVSTGSALYTLACIYGIKGGDPVRAAAQVCNHAAAVERAQQPHQSLSLSRARSLARPPRSLALPPSPPLPPSYYLPLPPNLHPSIHPSLPSLPPPLSLCQPSVNRKNTLPSNLSLAGGPLSLAWPASDHSLWLR